MSLTSIHNVHVIWRLITSMSDLACKSLPPLFFFAFYSKYLEATHTWKCSCKSFFCGCPYEKKIVCFTPSQSTLKFRPKNRPWTRGLRVIKTRFLWQRRIERGGGILPPWEPISLHKNREKNIWSWGPQCAILLP